MPSQLATLICFLFISYLFWTDIKRNDGPSKALWIPLIWMFLAGSRYVSSWLEIGKPMTWKPMTAQSYTDGSPMDAAFFFLLIVAGFFVLVRRNTDWTRLLSRNKWIVMYFLYCGISVVWSDYPFVSFKRWIKELGNPIMVLVILTEERPYEAVGVILRRLAILLLPLSVLFVRYYPDLGRSYHFDGSPMFTGVGHQKNQLGEICLISGIYLSWNFLLKQKENFKLAKMDAIADLILLGMVVWLIRMSESATAIACLVVAVGLFFMSRIKSIAQKPERIIMLGMIGVSLFFILNATLDLSNLIIEALGRDSTLTNRVPIWEKLKDLATDPIIGTGFMSFWTGDRLETIWRYLDAGIIQAHNGYLEQYLNLGYIGVTFIFVIMLSGLIKIHKQMNLDYPSAILRLSFIVTSALYNYSEATFYGISNMWLMLLLGVIELQARQEHKEPMIIL